MATADVGGSRSPQFVENVSFLTQRGKKESALLVILAGSSAPLNTAPIFIGPPDEVINTYSYITANKGSVFLTVLNSYPPDIIQGWEDYQGTFYPEPPFIQPWKANFGLLDYRSYTPYVPASDIIYPQFRRIAFFSPEDRFIKAQPSLLITNLVKIPIPPSDPTFRARQPIIFIEPEKFIQPLMTSWHIPLLPYQSYTKPPATPFTGAGFTKGIFTSSNTKGYFN